MDWLTWKQSSLERQCSNIVTHMKHSKYVEVEVIRFFQFVWMHIKLPMD